VQHAEQPATTVVRGLKGWRFIERPFTGVLNEILSVLPITGQAKSQPKKRSALCLKRRYQQFRSSHSHHTVFLFVSGLTNEGSEYFMRMHLAWMMLLQGKFKKYIKQYLI
jgi:hypothetical protein